ncbi:hypothetical protein [Aggregatibacter kilianii]|uniref:hypothetical protein n=1 Tax=Aggregatibacter kilianii TaxID=2025884 RepID=UPI000D64973C|nr:hypothetical protein [Aggregatibacter kilianii]
MNPLPKQIRECLKEKSIVSISAHSQDDFWAANCFYAFDEEQVRLIIMTKTSTRHGQIMLQNAHVVGTIVEQTKKVTEMEGVQFSGIAHLLESKDERKQAMSLYVKKQPLAKLMSNDIWEIYLTEIKHSSNKLVFAGKTYWVRKE